MRAYPGVFLLFVSVTGTAWGQRCIGHETFRRTHFYLGAGIDADPYAQTYGVDLRYGKAGVFGVVEAAIKTWGVETFNNESQKLGAAVGMSLSRDETSRVSVCPALSYRVFDGPDDASTFIAPNYHENVLAGSLSVGYLLSQSESWQIVPTLSLEMGTTNPTMRESVYDSPEVQSFCCGKRGFTTVTTGIGLTLGRVVTILPTVAIPLDEAGKTAYSLHFAIGLGKDN